MKQHEGMDTPDMGVLDGEEREEINVCNWAQRTIARAWDFWQLWNGWEKKR